MPKTNLKKTKWTLSFDPHLKELVVRVARRRGMYPVNLLEDLVRERFNPYGHTDIQDSKKYVMTLRKASRTKSDEGFLADIRAWQKSRSS